MPDTPYTVADLSPEQVANYFKSVTAQSGQSVLQTQSAYRAAVAAHDAAVAASQAATAPLDGITTEQQADHAKAVVTQAAGTMLNTWIDYQRSLAAHNMILAERDRLSPAKPNATA